MTRSLSHTPAAHNASRMQMDPPSSQLRPVRGVSSVSRPQMAINADRAHAQAGRLKDIGEHALAATMFRRAASLYKNVGDGNYLT